MKLPDLEDRCMDGYGTPRWCSKRRRRDLFLATCVKHAEAETWEILAEMVKYNGKKWWRKKDD